jgi:hypothetical protein
VKAYVNIGRQISGYQEHKPLIKFAFLLAVGGLVLINTNTDLYDATPIEYGVSNGLEPLHLI